MTEHPSPLPDQLAAAIDAAFPAQTAFYAELVRFPSTRGEEADCQDWIAGQLRSRGYEVDRYTLDQVALEGLPGFSPVMDTDYSRAVQVVGTRRAAGPTGRSLILQGHVDVVPVGPLALWDTPPFEPTIRDGWLHGRGAGDMKQGVAAIVFALDALAAAGLEPAADITVQTVTEEECTGNGALSTLARGYRADAVLIAEPTDGTITRAHVGVMWFRLRVRGIPVHVMQSQAGTNAILSAFHLIQALQAHTARLNAAAKADPWFGGISDPIKFNPGVIRGGDWASSTPAWCEVDCRISLLPGWSLEEQRRGILDCVSAAARADNFLANNPPEVEWNGFQADGYVLEPGTDAERALAAAHEQAFGAPMQARTSTAVNDTRFYGLYHRMPALCYGPRGEGHHGFNERGHLDTLRTTTLSIALFIAAWCGVRPISAPSAAPRPAG
ncbi:MAG: ArgE/DapE family deacylase [Janthinobacterium lividum]